MMCTTPKMMSVPGDKVDWQRLAREAGFVLQRDETMLREMLEHFAWLMLEEAAKVADAHEFYGVAIAQDIRSMKP